MHAGERRNSNIVEFLFTKSSEISSVEIGDNTWIAVAAGLLVPFFHQVPFHHNCCLRAAMFCKCVHAEAAPTLLARRPHLSSHAILPLNPLVAMQLLVTFLLEFLLLDSNFTTSQGYLDPISDEQLSADMSNSQTISTEGICHLTNIVFSISS